jgi:sporulation protein YlmC with PRC-barrel domain
MNEVKALNIASQIYGMPVIDPDTSMSLGTISDVVVHPTEGKRGPD